jgi:hypothetical protein
VVERRIKEAALLAGFFGVDGLCHFVKFWGFVGQWDNKIL